MQFFECSYIGNCIYYATAIDWCSGDQTIQVVTSAWLPPVTKLQHRKTVHKERSVLLCTQHFVQFFLKTFKATPNAKHTTVTEM